LFCQCGRSGWDMECSSVGPLRVACLGDSWVTDYERGEHADYWKTESPLPEGLQQKLASTLDREVELVIAGFPGYTAARLLDLARLCRLRDMSCVYSQKGSHLPRHGDLQTLLSERGISCSWSEDGWRNAVEEDVDMVVIIAGYNDLLYGELGPQQVVHRLLHLRQLYVDRGMDVVLVAIGQGSHDVESSRWRANKLLLAQGGPSVVKVDEFVKNLDRSMWANKDHLTPNGYRSLGCQLGSVVAEKICMKSAGGWDWKRGYGDQESRCTAWTEHTQWCHEAWSDNTHWCRQARKRRRSSPWHWPQQPWQWPQQRLSGK